MLDISDSLGDLASILKTKGNAMFNQSNVNYFTELVAKTNSENNGDHYKNYKFFLLLNCFALFVTLV